MGGDTREVIREAAFRLFAIQGYEVTTVDEIVREAGAARSTFFRLYGSKEAVVFPDHDRLLQLVEARLRSATAGSAESALDSVADAVKVVLFHYVAEGARARERYRLTSTVVTLRDRELISGARYQRLFRRYISQWGDGSDAAELRAELMAAAVVAAHNRVMRRWLRSECSDPHREIEAAMMDVAALWQVRETPEPVLLALPPGVSAREAALAILRSRPTRDEGH